MTSPRRFESDLPALLADLYLAGTPNYRDDLVRQTARMPQRPAWTFPGRWLPMELVTTRVPTTRLPLRQLGVLALIAILLAAVLAVYIGSRRAELPPPFGVARSGLVAYDDGGDIHVVDPTTGESRAIVTGAGLDSGPRFSRDGTRIVFERMQSGGRAQLYVVRVDGSELTLVTPESVHLTRSVLGEPWEQYQFSPDGRSILIATTAGAKPRIAIAQSDGGAIREIPLLLRATEPSFRPDGSEILFVGDGVLGKWHGIFAVNATSGAVRTIVEPSSDFDLAGANWSPDGTKVAYWAWGDGDGITARTHVVSADGTGDRLLPLPPDAVWQAGSDWSNDGTRLFVQRGYTGEYDDVRAVVIPADGSSVGVELAYDGNLVEDCCGFWEWAPDDSKILGKPAGRGGVPLQQVIMDPGGGGSQIAPWASTSDPAWQRLAP